MFEIEGRERAYVTALSAAAARTAAARSAVLFDAEGL